MSEIEENKLIAELEAKGYLIKENGEIWIVRKMKPAIGKSGYPMINIAGGKRGSYKTHSIHRLVAAKYISNPKSLPEVNHKDGNKLNCDVSNLEWCDRSHNIRHAIKNGLIKNKRPRSTGENHWKRKKKKHENK